MRITLLLTCVILAGGCTMPPLPVAQPAPVTPPEDVTAGWERYEDAEIGWSFAFPPGSRRGRETEELPWYTLITPAVDFPDGNVVNFGADFYAMSNDLSLARWVEMSYTVADGMNPATAGEWVRLDEDRADPQGLALETYSVGQPSYTFYFVHGNQVVKLRGPGTPEMASFLPLFASTMQFSEVASAHAEAKQSLMGYYQATMATRQALQSATPALDIVARDATAAAQLTPGPRATYAPEMQTQEAVYYRGLETATAVALLTPPPPIQPPIPAAMPIPAGQPGYALFRGSSVYQERPLFELTYDLAQWALQSDETTQQRWLQHLHLPGCALDLRVGGIGMGGATVVDWPVLGGYQWLRTAWPASHLVSYGLDLDGGYYLLRVRYAAEASREDAAACRSTAELVLDTFKVLD